MHFRGKKISIRFSEFIVQVSDLHFPWRNEHAIRERTVQGRNL